MCNLIKVVTIFLLVGLVAITAQAKDRQFPAPPDAKVGWISKSSNWNGFNLNGRKFESQDTTEEVLEFYRRLWRGNYTEYPLGKWQVIGAKEDGKFHTVQVQSTVSGGSWGVLSTSDLPEKIEDQELDVNLNVPQMNGSQIMSSTEDRDPGKKGRTVLLKNNFSANSNFNFYKRHYEGQGWTVMMAPRVPMGKPQTLVVRKGSTETSVVITRVNGMSNVVINEVQKKLF